MCNQKVQLNTLIKYLGDPTTKKDSNNAFYCPFCNHHKKKLEVDLETGLWNCWVCHTRGKSVSFLLKKINASINDISLVKSKEKYVSKKFDYKDSIVFLPNYYGTIFNHQHNFHIKRLLSYLESRGINHYDIGKYKIGYSSSNMDTIIVPSYDSNFRLNYYVEKNIVTGRYFNPQQSKNNIIFESFINWSSDIILVEGIFDAMAIQRNTIPLLGKILNTRLKESLVSSSCENVYIALDSGETKDIIRIAEYILSIGKKAFIVNLPSGEDPSSIGKENIWSFIASAEQVTESLLFSKKLML